MFTWSCLCHAIEGGETIKGGNRAAAAYRRFLFAAWRSPHTAVAIAMLAPSLGQRTTPGPERPSPRSLRLGNGASYDDDDVDMPLSHGHRDGKLASCHFRRADVNTERADSSSTACLPSAASDNGLVSGRRGGEGSKTPSKTITTASRQEDRRGFGSSASRETKAPGNRHCTLLKTTRVSGAR
ncbi:hypothetical protein GWI33_017515 [Rhynchophorus ferrugineus]|uniref:Uncharacterized protein n=1 Tax=Rhynchophorus ferrugineus TaxID=354439 RepID=A0A834HY23_RHYFE|nr:hypothetical protein GWI33_017515 [Rhynchophorus ferrugineus]